MAPAVASTSAAPASADAPATASSFPQVAIAEVVGVLNGIGLQWITAEEINKPTQQTAYRIFAQWLETLSGINQQWLDDRKREILAASEYSELYEDSLTWVLFFREMSTLMAAAQVTGFTSSDILRPQPKKFKRHMSALVNFYRFREESMESYEQFMWEMEDWLEKRDELKAFNAGGEEKVKTIKAQREIEAPRVAELELEAASFHQTTHDLKKEQNGLLTEIEELKDSKQRFSDILQELFKDIHYETERVRKLQSRVVTSPQELRNALRVLAEDVKEGRVHLNDTERKAKEFDARIALMRDIEEELITTSNVLVTLTGDQHALELSYREIQAIEADYENVKSSYSQTSQSLTAHQRQLENGDARFLRMKKTLDEKRELWKRREEEFSVKWEQCEGERTERQAEANKKSKEARDIEREIQFELKSYDEKIDGMVKMRNELVRMVEKYMEEVGSTLELEQGGIRRDEELERDVELLT